MKKIFFCISFIPCYTTIFAQANMKDHYLTQYLLPQFAEGTVKQKSGEAIKATLNYNTLTQEIVFQKDGQLLALDKIENVDTVFIQNKIFIPAGKVFYEAATRAPIMLYIQHQTDIIPPGSETGFGKTQSAAVDNVQDLKSSGRAYALKLPDEFQLKPIITYWLKVNMEYKDFKNVKELKNLLKDKTEVIDTYLKTNKVNFKKPDEVIQLVEYCNKN